MFTGKFFCNASKHSNKYDELELLLVQENIDVLCLSEHWLNPTDITVKNLKRLSPY